MIPVSVFICLLSVAILLFVYGVADLSNRIYGNIVAAIVGSVLMGYLSVIANTGIVGKGTALAMQDLSLQIILVLCTAIMMIYSLYMIVEAWYEYQTANEDTT